MARGGPNGLGVDHVGRNKFTLLLLPLAPCFGFGSVWPFVSCDGDDPFGPPPNGAKEEGGNARIPDGRGMYGACNVTVCPTRLLLDAFLFRPFAFTFAFAFAFLFLSAVAFVLGLGSNDDVKRLLDKVGARSCSINILFCLLLDDTTSGDADGATVACDLALAFALTFAEGAFAKVNKLFIVAFCLSG